jgi:hypothetical protein
MPPLADRIANLVSLRTAVLCANCEIISDGINGRCDACGSQALLRLKGILGETVECAPPFALSTPPLVADDSVRLGQLVATAA